MFNPIVRDSFFNNVDEIFNVAMNPRRRYKIYTGKVSPSANVSKDDKGYQISLAAPGLSRGDFNIEISDNVLTVSSENNVKEKNPINTEFSYNKFSRSWSLPEAANIENVTADYNAGILNVNIPVENVTVNKTRKIDVR